jgi:hypothetical protein
MRKMGGHVGLVKLIQLGAFGFHPLGFGGGASHSVLSEDVPRKITDDLPGYFKSRILLAIAV